MPKARILIVEDSLIVAFHLQKTLEKEGLLRIEYGGVTIVDLERLRAYGE